MRASLHKIITPLLGLVLDLTDVVVTFDLSVVTNAIRQVARSPCHRGEDENDRHGEQATAALLEEARTLNAAL